MKTLPTPEAECELAQFCNDVIVAVGKFTGVPNDEDISRLSELMKTEVKSFFSDPQYDDARQCYILGSLPYAYIIGSIAAEVVAKFCKG